jgi:cytochrome c oxidase subunit 2
MERSGAALRWLLPGLFLFVVLLTVIAFFVTPWKPPVHSEHGRGVDGMIAYIIGVAGAVFVIGHAVLAWFTFRPPPADGRGPAPLTAKTEVLWTVIPVLLMTLAAEVGALTIGMPVWGQVFRDDKEALQVEITGRQFEWIVRYPGKDGKFGKTDPARIDPDNPLGLVKKDPASRDDIVVNGAVTLPAGRPVQFLIRSQDVLHSFSVPLFRTKQDAVPGLVTRSRVIPTDPGEYEIACAELCGLGHYRMRGIVRVKTEEEFRKWLAGQVGFYE